MVGSNIIFLCCILTTLLFFLQKLCCIGVFCIVFQCFFGKIEKNLPIFCNFFSLCINDLRKSYKNNCTKHLTISDNVVSLQRV